MPPAPRHPDRRSVEELVEGLRDEALDIAPDLKGITAQQTSYGEAAQTLAEFEAALTQIASGAENPKAVAADALSLAKPLLPLDDPDDDAEDPIRDLLKPRRT